MRSYEQVNALLEEYEGRIPYMYRDSLGNVTVGVGQLLSTVTDAQALGFVNRKTQAPASAKEIETDFLAVKNQAANKLASYYRSFTALDLPDSKIDALRDQRVKEFESALRSKFSKWDSFPEDAQIALLDMIFNLGSHGLTTKFPKLVDAVNAEDWSTAANQCERQGIGMERNENTKKLFESAAKQKAAAEAAKQKAPPAPVFAPLP